jgi:hypothetical protein
LQFQGDQSPAVPGVDLHCQDGGKYLWIVSSDVSATVLNRNPPRLLDKKATIEYFIW